MLHHRPTDEPFGRQHCSFSSEKLIFGTLFWTPKNCQASHAMVLSVQQKRLRSTLADYPAMSFIFFIFQMQTSWVGRSTRSTDAMVLSVQRTEQHWDERGRRSLLKLRWSPPTVSSNPSSHLFAPSFLAFLIYLLLVFKLFSSFCS